MKVIPLPTRERMMVIIDSEDDTIVLKCLDFHMGIFSYSDNKGNCLFVAKDSDVDFYITDDSYKKAMAKKSVKSRLLEAGIQGWEGV